MLLLYILWDDWPIFYDFSLKWTATAAIRIHPTKAWLSQLVNFKNPIWTWRTICIKILFETWKQYQRNEWNASDCFRTIFHESSISFLSGVRDSGKAGSLWGIMRGVGGVRKSIHQSWLAKQLGLGLRLQCWGFKGVQGEIPSEKPALFKSGQRYFHQDNTPVHNFILVTDYLTKMSIKTVSLPSL